MTGEIIWREGDDALPEIFSQFSFMNSNNVSSNNSINRNLLGIETKPPLYIVSGFLGAGKTTLIKKLVTEGYKDEKIVVLENEFGKVGIDTDILKNEHPPYSIETNIESSNMTHLNDLESMFVGPGTGTVLHIGLVIQTGFTMLKEKSGRIIAQITSRYPFI